MSWQSDSELELEPDLGGNLELLPLDLLSSSEEETLPFEECLVLDLNPPVKVARRRSKQKNLMLDII